MPSTDTVPAISYTQVGKTGPRVLLLMGLGMPGELWKSQVEGLREQCRLIYFDNRGVGKSDAVGSSLSMLDMATDAARVLDAAGWTSQVHLVGVSMGGMVAQELALLQPQRFATMSLVATHAGGKGALVPPMEGLLRFMAVHLGPSHKRSQSLAKLLYPPHFLQTCDLDALHRRMAIEIVPKPKLHTFRKQLAAIHNHDTRSRLPSLELPTLIVKPELDLLVRPAHSDGLQHPIRHPSLMSVPHAGHGRIFQCPDQHKPPRLSHYDFATRE